MTVNNNRYAPRFLARRSWRFWFGSLLSLVSMVWLIVTTDWAEAWSTLVSANYLLVLLAVVINLLTIPIRSQRWRLLFPPLSRPPFGKATTVMLIGQAVNIFVPARLGDLVRATLIDSEPVAFVLGTQLLRIVLDLVMLAVLVLFLLFQVNLPEWWQGPGQALLVTSLLALLGVGTLVVGRRHLARLLRWLHPRWPLARGRRLLDVSASFLRSLEVFANPVLLMTLVGVSVVIWMFYAAVNYVLLGAVGAPVSWLAALFLLAVLLLGVAVPSTPGRVGVYHYLAVQALAVFGVDQATAVSYAILQHLITVILPSVLGALLAWKSGIGLPAESQNRGI